MPQLRDWMFGGYGVDANGVALGYLNDLWRYNPINGRWTWMSGSNTYGAPGVYGTKGVPATANAPGARAGAVAWINPLYDELWIFGGAGYDSQGVYDSYGLNDVFEYIP